MILLREKSQNFWFSHLFALCFTESQHVNLYLTGNSLLTACFRDLCHTTTHWLQNCHVFKVDGFQIMIIYVIHLKPRLVIQIHNKHLQRVYAFLTTYILWNKNDALQELSDITPIHTHSRNFGATVLMKFVATSLTTKSI